MANVTRAELIDRVLEVLGVKAAEQAANASDAKAVGEVVDSLHARLRGEDLVPFETTAIPEWAQIPFRDLVAYEAHSLFGITGAQQQTIAQLARRGREEMVKARLGGRLPLPSQGYFY